MSDQVQEVPYGVGKFTTGFCFFAVILALFMGVGLYAYYYQVTEGEIVTGMRDMGTMKGVPWGLYIVFVIYFIGISFAGITIAALVRLLKLQELRPIARMAELLTIVALLLGALCIIADVGQPLRALTYLFLYARPQSPFFGTFTMVVTGYLFASLVYFYLESRKDAAIMANKATHLRSLYRLWAAGYKDTSAEEVRHQQASFWLAIGIFPLLIIAHSTLGFVFGLQVGRPGWYSSLQAPSFVILAGVSGVGMLIIIAAFLRWKLDTKQKISDKVFRQLSNFMLILTLVYVYFMIVEVLTAVYTGQHHEKKVMEIVLQGEYAWIYQGSAALIAISCAILFMQWLSNKYQLSLILSSSIFLNIAAIGKRYAIVIPSQSHGSLLPYGAGSYSPTWVEYSVILGICALGIFLYSLFIKIFPIMELSETKATEQESLPKLRNPLRTGIALSMIAGGFVLQLVSYLYWTAPLGVSTSEMYSNPRVPMAPTFFIFGVILVFMAAIVYELIPDKKEQA